MSKNYLKIIIAFGLPLIAVAMFTFPLLSKTQTKGISDIEVGSSSDAWCSNSDEASNFYEQIPIVWTAKMDGCLVSCQGASFTKVPTDDKYPRFAGYYPDIEGNYYADNFNPIPDKFQKTGLTLKITGLWVSISDDHSQTVFQGKCIPIINIKQIEIVK